MHTYIRTQNALSPLLVTATLTSNTQADMHANVQTQNVHSVSQVTTTLTTASSKRVVFAHVLPAPLRASWAAVSPYMAVARGSGARWVFDCV